MSPSIATSQLQMILLIDRSGSMAPDGNIQAANTAIRETLPHLRRLSEEEALVDVSLRVLGFSSTAEWTVDVPVPVSEMRWTDLQPVDRGLSELGVGLTVVHDSVAGRHHLRQADPPPVVVVVSDGLWTDLAQPTAATAIARFDDDPATQRSPRLAIGIGPEPDTAQLERFVGTRGEVVAASSPHRLLGRMQEAWGTVIRDASRVL